MLNFYPSSNPEAGFEQKLVLVFNALDLIWVKIGYKIYLLYKLIFKIIELGSEFNRRHLHQNTNFICANIAKYKVERLDPKGVEPFFMPVYNFIWMSL